MNENELANYRAALNAALAALDGEDALGRGGQKTVTLDQQAVGRLSRMDALQNQAMAKAQAGRRAVQRQRITAALARMNGGEYGYCAECGDDLDRARLDADPTVPRCLSCTRG
tara:strand:- start:544 stop:882 length:339 start_codon:yes stop_codon:yes gene_type:complete